MGAVDRYSDCGGGDGDDGGSNGRLRKETCLFSGERLAQWPWV